MSKYLLLSHVKIQNANAMPSTLTIGFPAMTAWLGAVHALERKLRERESFERVRLPQTAVICHDCRLQVYRGAGDRVNSVSATANPLRKKGAGFERPPFIEEARVHLDVSLLVEIKGLGGDEDEDFKKAVSRLLPRMKIASGDVLGFKEISLCYTAEAEDERKVLRKLMPGYALIERRELLKNYTMDGKDALDAMLELVALHHHAEKDDDEEVTRWTYGRSEPGWLVPIAVGFKGLSPLGHVKHQRDPGVPHCFAEPLMTIGEWKMPHRFTRIDEMLWHYKYDEENALYLCRNQK